MTDTAQTQEAPSWTNPQKEKQERARSGIEFPYNSLDDAVTVVKAVQRLGGNQCRLDSLAAELGHDTTNSGGFRQKVSAAKCFGLSSGSQGMVTLTALGGRIVDSAQEKAAKVEAFLTVPLYKAIYEEFKNGALPPPSGLEAKMVALGVPEKQKDKARQAFHRSAREAGFFAYGPGKLVYPALGSQSAKKEEDTPDTDPNKNKNGAGNNGGDGHHPLIDGLIRALPKQGDSWGLDARRKWLQAAAMNFDYVYTASDADGRSIKVTVEIEKTSAN